MTWKSNTIHQHTSKMKVSQRAGGEQRLFICICPLFDQPTKCSNLISDFNYAGHTHTHTQKKEKKKEKEDKEAKPRAEDKHACTAHIYFLIYRRQVVCLGKHIRHHDIQYWHITWLQYMPAPSLQKTFSS